MSQSSAVGPKVMRATGVIVVASVMGYTVSFAKAALVAAYLGTGWQMDVFLWTFALVSLFATASSGPIIGSLMPVYHAMKAKDARLANDLLNAMLGLLFLAFGVLSLLMIVVSPLAIRSLGAGLRAEGMALALHLLRLMVPIVFFGGVWIACQCVLNAERVFFVPALSTSFSALAVIVSLLIASHEHAVYAQAIGLSIGAVMQWGVLMIVLWRKGLGRRWTLNVHVEGMGQVLKLLWPLLVTQILLQCLPIVDRTMAARFPSGTISALGYAQTLMTISATIFLTALQTAILPFLSQQMAEEGLSGFRKTFTATIRVLIVFTVPVCVVLVVLQEPIVRVVFERGAFDVLATRVTAPAFAAYMIGIVPMAATLTLGRGFSALQDSKTNALVGVVFMLVVKLVMNVVLIKMWGYLGLALATSVAYTATAAAMLWIMRRKLGGIEGRRLGEAGGKALVASAFAGILAWGGTHLAGGVPLLQVLLGGALALLGFGVAAYALQLDDIMHLGSSVIRFVRSASCAAILWMARS